MKVDPSPTLMFHRAFNVLDAYLYLNMGYVVDFATLRDDVCRSVFNILFSKTRP